MMKTPADLTKGVDISIPFRTDPNATSAWYVGPIRIEPVRIGDWVGSVKAGSSVNFQDVTFNPHGNGTHTECVGHIAQEIHSVNQHLKRWFFECRLITVSPQQKGEDKVIMLEDIKTTLVNDCPEAIIIRTLPNSNQKLHLNYSNTNPTYLEASAAEWLRDQGVEHLLIDLPSVDREEDGGALAAHKAFWNYPTAPRMQATITELVYVPSQIEDGHYLLNLQVAPIENDASPSRPVLYSVD